MYLGGIREKIWQPVYGFSSIANGATAATFFDVAVGGAVGLDQTNLRQVGQLPAPYMYLVQGMAFTLPADIDRADSLALLTQSVLQFFVNTKTYLEIPVRKLGGGNSPWIAAAATSNAAPYRIGQFASGSPDARNYYRLSHPIKVGVLANFRATITFQGGVVLGATRLCKLYLMGTQKRSVQ